MTMKTIINGIEVSVLPVHKTNPEYKTSKQQVFIIGSKGIPASYGGFETFVEKLTQYQINKNIRYHIARLGDNNVRYEYNGAKCFNVKVPSIGAAKAVYYDLAALKYCIDYCKLRPQIKRPVFYILACRIGPFIRFFKKEIERLDGVLYLNPDGHEWLRKKWVLPVRKYWKLSEKLMVKYADLLICDSKTIESYIQKEYLKYTPRTCYISYGSDTKPSILKNNDCSYMQWMENNGITYRSYYLVVGRFVPENNFKIMIGEFMKSSSKHDFVLVTTANEIFLRKLESELHFECDKRIKFVGTIYDSELLKKIRENAYGYLHGHEVGGTNPSLLEALAFTNLNLLLDVGFNREVAEDGAVYWTKESGNLASLIEKADQMKQNDIEDLGVKAKKRIRDQYQWNYIVNSYEHLFLDKR